MIELAFNVAHAAKTIETSLCAIAGYDTEKALKGLAALTADMRENIKKRCEEMK